jgi:hypothetical protein
MPVKPLVFVPGLPGTVLRDPARNLELFPDLLTLTSPSLRADLLVKLSGPDDPDADDGVIPGDPVSTVIPGIKSSFIDFSGSFKLADSLYDLLQGLGYATQPFGDRFQPVGWDWRRPVDQARAQGAVGKAITDLHTATGERVVVFAHSTGGLVLRGLLEGDPALVDLLDQVISVSVPWAGTLQPLPYISGQQGFLPLSADETQHILGRSWAAFDLLPPDPAKTEMTDAEGDLDFFTVGQGQSSPLIATAWIPTGLTGHAMAVRAARSDARFGKRSRSLDLGGRSLEVVAFAGWGGDTLTGCEMDPQGNLGFQWTDQGDGTIARRSAAWLNGPGVRNFLVPVGHYPDSQITREHSSLWLNPPVRDLLGTLLAGRPQPPYTYAAVDGDDAINDVPLVHVRLVAQDAGGNPLPGAYARAFGLQGVDDATRYLLDNGRGLMPLSRGAITQNAAGGWYRFEVEFHWLEGGADQAGPRQVLLVQRPG